MCGVRKRTEGFSFYASRQGFGMRVQGLEIRVMGFRHLRLGFLDLELGG